MALGGALQMTAADEKKEPEKKPPETKKGTATGLLVGKGDKWIEVKADGEEKPRRYVPQWVSLGPNKGGGLDPKTIARINDLKVGSRIRVEWEFDERARVMKVEVLKAPEKTGTVTGTLTAKDTNWIEVKADGEEAARRYTVYMGGTKEILQAIKDAPLESRVRVEWLFSERARVVKLEILKAK
jgi:hypothetical protein